MSKIYNSIEELVGKTPLLRLCSLEKLCGAKAKILAKIEFFNPAGSAKDRVALAMITRAEQSGALKKGGVIIEPTSGNTGIGLAAIGVSKGYRVIVVMPENMSEERKKLIKAYGGELVLTDRCLGMSGAIEKAKELAKEIPESFIPDQFSNVANPTAHYQTTGPEIYNDTDGNLDVFVAGAGTGGTVTGVGRYLKEKNKDIKIIAVEPEYAPYISQGKKGTHGIQGIGANFIPEVLDTSLLDGIITVTDEQAYEFCALLGRTEGILAGISSGAALCAAVKIALLEENEGKTVVVLLPDTGERYLSAKVFD